MSAAITRMVGLELKPVFIGW